MNARYAALFMYFIKKNDFGSQKTHKRLPEKLSGQYQVEEVKKCKLHVKISRWNEDTGSNTYSPAISCVSNLRDAHD
jgi:hypothetical protein